MAKLSAFTVNSRAQEEGEWIAPGDEFDDLELKVRGFTPSYYDEQARLTRRAAVQFDGDTTKVPRAKTRDILISVLRSNVFLDVRNLADGDGNVITGEQFSALMANPDHGDLVVAVMRAAARVGRAKAAEVEENRGN